MILQFWKACRFCNKKSLTVVPYANVTLVKVINKISVSISCAVWIVFNRKQSSFWSDTCVPYVLWNTIWCTLWRFQQLIARVSFFEVTFYLSILTKPQLIGDPGDWSLRMLYRYTVVLFSTNKFIATFCDLTLCFTWFNTVFFYVI